MQVISHYNFLISVMVGKNYGYNIIVPVTIARVINFRQFNHRKIYAKTSGKH